MSCQTKTHSYQHKIQDQKKSTRSGVCEWKLGQSFSDSHAEFPHGDALISAPSAPQKLHSQQQQQQLHTGHSLNTLWAKTNKKTHSSDDWETLGHHRLKPKSRHGGKKRAKKGFWSFRNFSNCGAESQKLKVNVPKPRREKKNKPREQSSRFKKKSREGDFSFSSFLLYFLAFFSNLKTSWFLWDRTQDWDPDASRKP